MDCDDNDENVALLFSMGFYDESEIKWALRVAKNDVSEAVSLLTNDVSTLTNSRTTQNASTSCDNGKMALVPLFRPNSLVENMEVDAPNSDALEFPATHFYELQSRVFTVDWNIPFKRNESLGRCLVAAIKFAKAAIFQLLGLAESEETCKQFLNKGCLRACLEKLTTSYQVNRWAQDIHEGIFHLLQLFVDLICARLQYEPLPTELLDLLAMVFDPVTNFQRKNHRKNFDRSKFEADFGPLIDYAINPMSDMVTYGDEPFGYLVDLIDRFGHNDGFDLIGKKFELESTTCMDMAYLIKPFCFCVDFLNVDTVGFALKSCVDQILNRTQQFLEDDNKVENANGILVELMGYCKVLLMHLHRMPDEAGKAEDLQLAVILKLLKVSNYGVRMHALKELTKLLDLTSSTYKLDERLSISEEKLTRWLTDREILPLALEGSIDQAQYCDRLRTLFLFLGPKLSCQDLGKVWALRRGRAAVTVENVHGIVAQTAPKLGRTQFDFLLGLMKKGWNSESDRSREKLILLLGKIGQEANVEFIFEKTANLLWTLAHQENLRISLLTLCMDIHLSVVTVSNREKLRKEYVDKCLEDIKAGSFVLPALAHMHNLLECTKKSSMKSQKSIIVDLVNKQKLVESLCDNLTRMQKIAEEMCRGKCEISAGNKIANSDTPSRFKLKVIQDTGQQNEKKFDANFQLPDGFTYAQHVDQLLNFLRFLLVEGELYLLAHRCEELWDALVVNSMNFDYAKEAAFSWFLKGIGDLNPECRLQLFQTRVLQLDPRLYTGAAFACFQKFFESVNASERKLLVNKTENEFWDTPPKTRLEVEKFDLLGLDHLWSVALNCPDEGVARDAVDLLVCLHFNYLSPKLKLKDPVALHKMFLAGCNCRLDAAMKKLFEKRSVGISTMNSESYATFLSDKGSAQNFDDAAAVAIRNVERLLLAVRIYSLSASNALHSGGNVAVAPPSHASTFFTTTPTVAVDVQYERAGGTLMGAAVSSSTFGSKKDSVSLPKIYDLRLVVDENETQASIRHRIAALFELDYESTGLELNGEELPTSSDHVTFSDLILSRIRQKANVTSSKELKNDPASNEFKIKVKKKFLITASSNKLCNTLKSRYESNVSGATTQHPSRPDPQCTTPASIMAQDPTFFQTLYRLTSLNENSITRGVRDLLLYMPTDPAVSEKIDKLVDLLVNVNQNDADAKMCDSLENGHFCKNSCGSISCDSNRENLLKIDGAPRNNVETVVAQLLLLNDGKCASPFQLLYNLEALSARILPACYSEWSHHLIHGKNLAVCCVKNFSIIQSLVGVLICDFLPSETDHSLRRQIYARVMQILRHLLCDQSNFHDLLANHHENLRIVGVLPNVSVEKTSEDGATAAPKVCRFESTLYTIDKTSSKDVAAAELPQFSTSTVSPPSVFKIDSLKNCTSSVDGAAAPTVSRVLADLCAVRSPSDEGGSPALLKNNVQTLDAEVFRQIAHILRALAWNGAVGGLGVKATVGLSNGTSAISGYSRSRTSDSSTGSNSDTDSCSSTNLLNHRLLAAVSRCPLTPVDVQLTRDALTLLVDCLCQRPQDMGACFFFLPRASNFMLDMVLGAESAQVRHEAVQQFWRLAESGATLELEPNAAAILNCAHSTHCKKQKGQQSEGQRSSWGAGVELRKAVLEQGVARQSGGAQPLSPPQCKDEHQGQPTVRAGFLLFHILLKAPLPFWGCSSNPRGSAKRLLPQCGEYFDLRGRLLSKLTPQELTHIQPTPCQMLDDETKWLLNFAGSQVPAVLRPVNYRPSDKQNDQDSALLTGHLKSIAVLLELLPSEAKAAYGPTLISPLLGDFLFPAARNSESVKNGQSLDADSTLQPFNSGSFWLNPTCRSQESRAAVFKLFIELCRGCLPNYQNLTKSLLLLHHQSSPDLLHEYEFSPLVDTKWDNFGFVGLKNAGATCYMNAVLQQFFMEPGLADAILSIEIEEGEKATSLLREVQRLFGHLKESQQQYYVPKFFWDTFKLWGQQVNPREQQDAFEFFCCIIDQISEILKKLGRDEIFKNKYQGVFSDQKICQGCPHRFEREESFYALNLPVRSHNLEESLNNFVKGEILEGENAYFCDRCGVKRTTLKRMCIKTLPPVLAIQLKRFNYDWEEMRSLKYNDVFEFPTQLDLYPYTSAALSQLEGGDDFDAFASPMISGSSFAQFFSSPSLVNGGGSSGSVPGGSGSTVGNSRSHTIADNLCGSASTPKNRRPMLTRGSTRLSSGNLQFTDSIRFELTGIIVHSGQASAGHYYSYVKDRRDEAVPSGTYNKWFKFNDTSVESVDMTTQFMETELFGGKYKAKADKNSSFPEERERYWNAYILFYCRVGNSVGNKNSPRTASKRSVSMSCTNSSQTKSARRRDSLMELAELVEQGEQLQLFNMDSGILAWLRNEVRDENLKFFRNRDIFNESYVKFVANLCKLGVADISSDGLVELGRTNSLYAPNSGQQGCRTVDMWLACSSFCCAYLFNTALRCKKPLRTVDSFSFSNFLLEICQKHEEIRRNTLEFLICKFKYCKEYLFDCTSSDVRQEVADFCGGLISYDLKHTPTCQSEYVGSTLLLKLFSLVKSEAAEKWQNAPYLFGMFFKICAEDTEPPYPVISAFLQCNAFSTLLGFLLGREPNAPPTQSSPPPPTLQSINGAALRRWTANQSRDFKDVYNVIAALVSNCDWGQSICRNELLMEQATLAPSTHAMDQNCAVTSIPSDGTNLSIDTSTVAPTPVNASSFIVEGTVALVPSENVKSWSHESCAMFAPPLDALSIFGRAPSRRDFCKEFVWACINVAPSAALLRRAARRLVAGRLSSVVGALVVEALIFLRYGASYDVRHALIFLEEAILCVDDGETADLEWEMKKAVMILDGIQDDADPCSEGGSTSPVDGVLSVIKSCQSSDARRSYACVKFLSRLSGRSSALKGALNDRLDAWRWAVDWLRGQIVGTSPSDDMAAGDWPNVAPSSENNGEDSFVTASTMEDSNKSSADATSRSSASICGPSSSGQSDRSVKAASTNGKSRPYALVPPLLGSDSSNDDPSQSQFRRTISARTTLDEAEALLNELVQPTVQSDCAMSVAEPSPRSSPCDRLVALVSDDAVAGTSEGRKSSSGCFPVETTPPDPGLNTEGASAEVCLASVCPTNHNGDSAVGVASSFSFPEEPKLSTNVEDIVTNGNSSKIIDSAHSANNSTESVQTLTLTEDNTSTYELSIEIGKTGLETNQNSVAIDTTKKKSIASNFVRFY